MDIKSRLKSEGVGSDKRFGQNFIFDENLLAGIVDDAGLTDSDTVLEIGAGAGTLTRELAVRAGRVVTFEIDKRLSGVLNETVGSLGNVEVVFGDIMKASDGELNALLGERYKVVANLPYYITTPIIFMLLERTPAPETITVMVQKEVAERIVATEKKGDYGALSVSVALRARAQITRVVTRDNFTPPPNVDSAVVRMDVFAGESRDLSEVSELVSRAFAMKRKTLANNLCAGYGITKFRAAELLSQMGLNESVRAEQLSPERFIELSRLLKKSL